MKRVVLVAAVAALALAAMGQSVNPMLVATVGPGFTIDLADGAGKHVDSLPSGHYTLLVHDLSDEHNFVLADKPAGLRLRVETTVPFVGDQTFDIDLRAGRYAYACSPHFEVMNGAFTVFDAAPATPAKTLRTLRATVAKTVSLSAKRVAPGRYRVAIADRSSRANFHLLGPGVNRRTGRSFVGTTTWTLTLAKGTYAFGTDPSLNGRLVVA
jgi:hypothetical protein